MRVDRTMTSVAAIFAVLILASCATIPGEHTIASDYVVTRSSQITPGPSDTDVDTTVQRTACTSTLS